MKKNTEQQPVKQTFKVEVSHTRGKYAAKIYTVEASSALAAYDDAFKLYRKDNNHPAYVPGKSYSAYCAPFFFKIVK